MYLKHLILIVSTIMCASSKLLDVEEMYLNFFVQLESVKKSVDILKVRLDAISEKNLCSCSSDFMENKFVQVFENFEVVKKSLDDLNTRLDSESDKGTNKPQELKSNPEDLKILPDTFVQEMSEVKQKYSKLWDELNAVKKSEENLLQRSTDLEAKYLDILQKYDNNQKSNVELKQQLDELKKHISSILAKEQAVEDYETKHLYDVRVDKLPEFKKHCSQDPAPTDCKAATKCTRKSGYYKIHLPGNKTKHMMAFCDLETKGGDWLHILRRLDGSVNFTRPWSDYVQGFGSVEGEYWIGLDNLHALTNHNGRQELYVHIENFEAESSFALYDNFVVGNASEMYELKSLGNYKGLGEDDMEYNVGSKFSTIDDDNDNWPGGSCARERQAGWWYTYCTYVQPTGQYLRGESSRNGVLWRSFGGLTYSHKVMYLMIRNV